MPHRRCGHPVLESSYFFRAGIVIVADQRRLVVRPEGYCVTETTRDATGSRFHTITPGEYSVIRDHGGGGGVVWIRKRTSLPPAHSITWDHGVLVGGGSHLSYCKFASIQCKSESNRYLDVVRMQCYFANSLILISIIAEFGIGMPLAKINQRINSTAIFIAAYKGLGSCIHRKTQSIRVSMFNGTLPNAAISIVRIATTNTTPAAVN